MKSPNPTLQEINQWRDELPTIEDLKKLAGFEIGKAYYFVRIGGKWRIGKENPYIDAKNLASKPDNILCFANEPDMNKRIAGQRDCESSKLHTVRIQAIRKESTNFDRLLVGMGLRKEFLEFVWEKSPREIYEKQIEEYKRTYNINNGITILLFITIVVLSVFLNINNLKPQNYPNQNTNLNYQVISQISSQYQQLSLPKKKLFLRKTGLYIVVDSKVNIENYSFKDLLIKYFEKNKHRFDEDLQKNLFLENLSNQIRDI